MPVHDVDRILRDLKKALNDSIASISYSKTALGFFRSHMEELPALLSATFPNSYFDQMTVRVDYSKDPDGPDSNANTPESAWSRSEIIDRLVDDGPVDQMLSRLWIISFFSQWEEHFRPCLAGARGIEPSDLEVPLLGDLRLLRNYSVHHGGIVKSDWESKSQVLKHWFRPGDAIHLTGAQFKEFESRFPWDQLRGR